MIKRLLTASILLLVSLQVNAAEESTEIFGVKFLSTVNKYVASVGEAEPNAETKSGYKELFFTPPKPHPSFDDYELSFDSETKVIHEIFAFKSMAYLDICSSQMRAWAPRIEKKYSVSLADGETVSGDIFTVYANAYLPSGNSYVDIRCNTLASDGSVYLYLIWRTLQIDAAIDEYYKDLDDF
jgi:hypothetical protein